MSPMVLTAVSVAIVAFMARGARIVAAFCERSVLSGSSDHHRRGSINKVIRHLRARPCTKAFVPSQF
jgi:hypothetical protein